MAQIILEEGIAPSTPALGTMSIYAKSDGLLYMKDDLGVESKWITLNGNIGTPSAGIATNLTGTAVGLTAGNVTTNANLTGHITSTGNATVLGSFTSLNLLTALTDETGTGANVFATSPTLVTPLLGTPTSGTLTNCTGLPTAGIVDLAVTTAKIAAAAVTQAKVKIQSVVALADAAATLTATQMIDSTIFTITPTVARTLTTDTAANLVLGLPGYQIGTWFDIVIINNAAFDVTLAAGVGVTLVGKAIVNNVSGTWKCRFDSATAVTIYRM